MPNIRGAKKRVRGNGRKAVFNTYVGSSMKTAIKNFEKSVKENDKEAASKNLNIANQRIDKAKKNGLIKENKASRAKSRLMKMKNNME